MGLKDSLAFEIREIHAKILKNQMHQEIQENPRKSELINVDNSPWLYVRVGNEMRLLVVIVFLSVWLDMSCCCCDFQECITQRGAEAEEDKVCPCVLYWVDFHLSKMYCLKQ